MTSQWQRFCQYLVRERETGITLDVSRMAFDDGFLTRLEVPMSKAFAHMQGLEAGDIANPDEGRQVGHYWLRAPELAPDRAVGAAISSALEKVKEFVAAVHGGKILSASGKVFRELLLVGIGGSALGPQLVADALGTVQDRMRVSFLDNTDPDGMDRVFSALGPVLEQTLVLVISKSGSTAETRNGMLETQRFFKSQGVPFAPQAVAVTGEGSQLFRQSVAEQWLERFPMWDFVGGRTSVMSPVGLLPAALQGIDIDAFLEGARQMDAHTRQPNLRQNQAALLSAMWYYAGDGHGRRDMVVLPYKDRLLLFSRYLQQLVMESLGKELDRAGRPVWQGLSVYGNKGSTDQHAYVQQLRDGLPNFFVTFVKVLTDRALPSPFIEPDVTSGDYLLGFLEGTRQALTESRRESISVTLEALTPKSLGALIALYERSVGLYADLIGINAYHQPGVEAGKKAAGRILALQKRLLERMQGGALLTAEQWAREVGEADAERVWQILEHLRANGRVILIEGKGTVDGSYGRRAE